MSDPGEREQRIRADLANLRRLDENSIERRAQAEATSKTTAVIAQYLTVGGATVDITKHRTSVTAHCNGCPDTSSNHWWPDDDSPYNVEAQERMAIEAARRWAQSHASTCRAMPKPAGAQ
jgi:hypothetical protein